jgi:hypothetical protein
MPGLSVTDGCGKMRRSWRPVSLTLQPSRFWKFTRVRMGSVCHKPVEANIEDNFRIY